MSTLLTPLAQALGQKLKERGETVAVSESAAGGLIAASLLAVPGASTYFLGGAVVYTQNARRALLDLTEGQMRDLRSASEPYAALCAATIRRRLDATWGLAETGAAGPSGNRYGDAPGHACLAVDGPRTAVMTLETASADREANMWTFAQTGLQLLIDQLE